MKAFELGLLLVVSVVAATLLSQEEVPPRTTYETAQRVTRMALDLCYEDLTGNLAKYVDRISVQSYLRCVSIKLDEILTDYETGDPIEKPDLPKPADPPR